MPQKNAMKCFLITKITLTGTFSEESLRILGKGGSRASELRVISVNGNVPVFFRWFGLTILGGML